MAVANVTATLTGWTTNSSPYGVNIWSAATANIQSGSVAGDGTIWMIWNIKVPGIAPGETFNGINLSGINDFTVGAGGGGITRVANIFAGLFASVAAFAGQSGSAAGSVIGSGAGVAMNVTLTSGAFTSTDVVNGSMFVGVAIKTTTADLGSVGLFRYNARSFTVYTGPDLPTQPPARPAGTLANPPANIDPGVLPGSSFASLTFTLSQPLPQSFLQMQFVIVGTTAIRFSNGTQTLTLAKGTGSDPGSPYIGVTGAITTLASAVPGTYTVYCEVQGIPGQGLPYRITSTLVVQAASPGSSYWEV